MLKHLQITSLVDSVEIIKECGLKVTHPRLEVLKYLQSHPGHHTVDSIYRALKKDNPSLSKTTVYNNLEVLRDKKVVGAVIVSEKETRYEIGGQHHHHFYCNECGKIADIEVSCPLLGSMLNGEYRVEEVHGYFKGTCRSCLDKKEK